MNLRRNGHKKYLLVKAKGGMGNRMLCALTGILYGQITQRKIIVDWRDAGYSNDRSNTFSRFFDCTCIYPETVLPAAATIRPAVWKNNLDKSMSEMISRFDPDKHSSLRIHRKYSVDIRKKDFEEDILVFWNYSHRIPALMPFLRDSNHGFAGLSERQIIRKAIKEFLPLSQTIKQHIDEIKKEHWHRPVIGVHVRYTDRKARLKPYERTLNRFIEHAKKPRIFLATDSKHIEQWYRENYDDVFSTPKWFPENSQTMHQNPGCPDRIDNGIEALVDMYLLADCDYLIYPGNSTFSWISAILSEAPRQNVVDVEKYNPKVRLKTWIRRHLS